MVFNQIEVFIKKEEIYLLKILTIKLFMKEITKKMGFIIHKLHMIDGSKISN